MAKVPVSAITDFLEAVLSATRRMETDDPAQMVELNPGSPLRNLVDLISDKQVRDYQDKFVDKLEK